ncbi:MAG: hypothetical protein ACC642_11990, partial [Pseudomonadales bacterium]
HVLRMHGLEDLGLRLHKLSLDGRWQEMREIITEDDLLKLADTCTYDGLPKFVEEKREYASQMGFSMPSETDEDAARARDIMHRLQQIEPHGVPKGLEF